MESEFSRAWRELREGRVPSQERVPVRQRGRLVGTLPGDFSPHRITSRSFLYDPRPGDFRREGDEWIADKMLGPGDLAAIPGFENEPRDDV